MCTLFFLKAITQSTTRDNIDPRSQKTSGLGEEVKDTWVESQEAVHHPLPLPVLENGNWGQRQGPTHLWTN